MHYSLVLLLGLFSPLTQGILTREREIESRVIHERHIPHPSYNAAHQPPANLSLPLRIGLKQRNLALLPTELLAISDPASPLYGRHWTPAQVLEAFAPPEEAGEIVRRWLVSEGVGKERVRWSADKAWIDVRSATVGEVEKLIGARYRVFRRGEEEEYIACDSYTLPRSIADVVDIITPTVQPNTKLAEVRRSLPHNGVSHEREVKRASVAVTGCDKAVTPDCLKALYNMTYVPQATDRNSMAIVNYYSNSYLQSDLDMFFANFSPALLGKSPELVSIDGGTLELDESSSVGEAGWVLQYAMTLAQPQPVKLLQLGNKQTGEFRSFNEWLDAVDASYCTSNGGDDFTYDPQLPNPRPGGLNEHSCGALNPPNVVSNSQADHEYRFSQFYLERQCAEFGKLGLMGVTVLYAAGNTGVSGAQSGYCLDRNGAMNLNATNFNPAWPASCPWVTTVGGTQVKANATVAPGAEEVWNEDLTSGFFLSGGGGFSNRFTTPGYQKHAVKGFLGGLKKTDPGLVKHFNARGRAYPDLSANANSFVNVDNGEFVLSSGTSGAVPTVASIITLVNDARIAAGKTPVGFINPAIYSPAFASAFNDITSGTSQGCKGLQGDRGGGFKAGRGWDPASGLGTPNLGLLIEKWLELP
ncbi:Tripeptidyl-peptidase sed1 [Hypsizygus marmoreus]|uniref:Tripeptidyl-peptidase sed1 n=1 Tax=Hypsizygus marmoreus TaxID=39966 RepID=A0A369K979_HYPMA|nr:Tripeptidyl-peptidase sed1 [Hypsizygus marmoreus]